MRYSRLGISCFEYPSQRAELKWETMEVPGHHFLKRIHNHYFVSFTKTAARTHDRVYHLTGCPMTFVFRESGTEQTFVGLAILKKHQDWEVAQDILEGLSCPDSLPRAELESEFAMAKIFVHVPTLASAIVLTGGDDSSDEESSDDELLSHPPHVVDPTGDDKFSDGEFSDGESSDDELSDNHLPSPWEILGARPLEVIDLTRDDEPGNDEVSNLPSQIRNGYIDRH